MPSQMERAKRVIAASYERSAADFARFADRLVYRYLAAPLAEQLHEVEGPVLDVASGTGALGRLFARAVATDISHAQLLHNDVALRAVADVEGLPFRTRTFAAAVSAFGINHFPDVDKAVAEMARVATVIGLLTWARPEVDYAPKHIVLDIVERHAGKARTEAGDVVDELTDATGTTDAVAAVLRGAGLAPRVEEVTVEVPWPGAASFVDYRMTMTGVIHEIDDVASARREAIAAIDALPRAELEWRPRLVLGLGRPSA